MHKFLALPVDERRVFFEEAAARMRIRPYIVEKDFWVCWALKNLFELPDVAKHLTFKGGTSLSKAYKIIERFSEDVDVTIAREFLGFGKDHDPEHAPSNKKKKAWLSDLKDACRKFVAAPLLPMLNDTFSSQISGFSLRLDVVDLDQQTLIFEYPTCCQNESPGYISSRVKIELGARSDTWPSEQVEVTAYVAEQFPQAFDKTGISVQVLAKERTFWEKLALLHEENSREVDIPVKPRLSRHYSDLARMIDAGVSQLALAEPELFERVVEHRSVYFAYRWVDYEQMKPGSIRLLPRLQRVPEWAADYAKMHEMFFRDPPEFEEVLAKIGDFERQLNSA